MKTAPVSEGRRCVARGESLSGLPHHHDFTGQQIAAGEFFPRSHHFDRERLADLSHDRETISGG